jgi:uncharacterized protein (TIGR00269 family)
MYVREHEGVAYCSGCFREAIEERFRKTVIRHKMLEYNDHVAVAVSGGKDSLTLLNLLMKLEGRFPRTTVTAVSVDEGIDGYRDEALDLARKVCDRLGVRQVVVSYRELFGTTTDEIAGMKLGQTPCSYCGVFRRKAINKAAAMVGATKIATAHNLDDEVQTILLNMLHGDPVRIVRSGPVLRDPRGKFLPRIKPLAEIPEKEIVLYAYLTGTEFQSIACPHGHEALRNDIRSFLNQMDLKHPGSKFTLQKSAEKLRTLLAAETPLAELQECERCGDPTPHELCEACLMLGAIAA